MVFQVFLEQHHIDGFNIDLPVEIFGGWGVACVFIKNESERGVLDHLEFVDFTVWNNVEWDCCVDQTGQDEGFIEFGFIFGREMLEASQLLQLLAAVSFVFSALWSVAVAVEAETKRLACWSCLNGLIVDLKGLLWGFEEGDSLKLSCVGFDFPLFFVLVDVLDSFAGVGLMVLIVLPGGRDLGDIISIQNVLKRTV